MMQMGSLSLLFTLKEITFCLFWNKKEQDKVDTTTKRERERLMSTHMKQDKTNLSQDVRPKIAINIMIMQSL